MFTSKCSRLPSLALFSEEIECNESIGTLVVSMGIQCIRPDGKPARSRFRKLWSDGNRSVVSVNIYTGRTHQIRVHAQFLGKLGNVSHHLFHAKVMIIGYPIVGDQIYNSFVWGKSKGKAGDYGKSYEEVGSISFSFNCRFIGVIC